MEFLIAGSSIALLAVFATSAITKLLDPPGFRAALLAFGVGRRLVPPAAIGLPFLEGVVAVLFLSRGTAAYGAFGALILLCLFSTTVGVSLSRGRRPDCHCFGQLRSEPVGWKTLVRNGALGALAMLVAVSTWAEADPQIVSQLMGSTYSERLIVCAAVAALALLVTARHSMSRLSRQVEELKERVDRVALQAPVVPGAGLPVGAAAPFFDLPDLTGARRSIRNLLEEGKPVVLVFSDPNCGPCAALLPDVSRWQLELTDRLSVVLVSRGTADANRANALEHHVSGILLQVDREVAQAYGVMGTPSAVLVDPKGTVGAPLAQGEVEIRRLVSSAAPVSAVTAFSNPSQPMASPAPIRTIGGIRRPPPDTLPAGAMPVRQDCVHDELLDDGTIVLYNGCRHEVLTLNATAALVWECCDGSHDVDAIVAEVRDAFPDAPDADRDVRAMLDMLLRGYMIAPALPALAPVADVRSMPSTAAV